MSDNQLFFFKHFEFINSLTFLGSSIDQPILLTKLVYPMSKDYFWDGNTLDWVLRASPTKVLFVQLSPQQL